MSTPHIDQLRTALLNTLADLRDREKPMEPDRARAVAQVAGVLVDSARVEVEFLRATGGDTSAFLSRPPAAPALPNGTSATTTTLTATGTLTRGEGRAVHRMRDDE